jgi:uncharacterized protein YgiM (DUF1202 family)
MAKYNIPAIRVVRHYDASRKICPRAWSPNNWANWLRFKSDVLGNVVTPPKTEVKTETKAKPKYKEEKFTTEQVTDVSLNIRAEPNTSSRVVGTLNPGTKFTPSLIVKNGTNVNGYTTWCKHPKGWVSMAYTTPTKYTPKPKVKLKGEDLPSKGSFKFTDDTNIRSGAGTNYGIVGLYAKGKTVNYDSKVIAGGYVWLSYIGHSGYRRYVAVT